MHEITIPTYSVKKKIIFVLRSHLEKLFGSYIELSSYFYELTSSDKSITDYSNIQIKWDLLKNEVERLSAFDKILLKFCDLEMNLNLLNNLEDVISIHNKQVSLLIIINEFEIEFNRRINDKTDYLTCFQVSKLKESIKDIKFLIQDLIDSKFKLKTSLSEKIDYILDLSKELDSKVTNFNTEFIKNELEQYADYFNSYEGRGLNEEQKIATVIQENKVLVNAGAGSGKTSVISARIGYLVKFRKINPKDILLITFTRDGKDNMKQRVLEKAGVDIDARTIHSLGGSIIREFEGRPPALAKESETRGYLKLAFSNLIRNSNLAKLIKDFYMSYNYEVKSIFDFKSIEDFIAHRKEIKDFNASIYDLHSKKQYVPGKTIKTLSGEKVRSFEEKAIADYLFLNGIKFFYETQYRFPENASKKFKYQPDFYLPDQDIYIEHFGIDRNGNVPNWFKTTHKKFTAGQIYNYQINKKINLHKENKTKLITTFSYEFNEEIILNKLDKELKRLNVIFNPIDDISAIKGLESDVLNLIGSFLSLFKSGNYNFQEVEEKNKDVFSKSNFNQIRAVKFIDIFRPIFENYQSLLLEHKKIDFSDYVRKSFQYLNEKGELLSKDYKHIIIDEFQDTSFGMMKLVKALDELAEDKRLFFVGDDWQSIFKFNGADVTLMLNFEKEFDDSSITKLEYNFRSRPNIVSLGKMFISKNPFQLEKNVKSFKGELPSNKSKEIVFLHTSQIREALERINLDITKENRNLSDFKDENIKPDLFIISRYKDDADIVKDLFVIHSKEKKVEPLIEIDQKSKIFKYKNIKIRFLTVHASKGLEAKYVIILPPLREKLGFPSSIPDDPILKLVTASSENYEYAEERRLMYVAMTRAEEQLFFVLDNGETQTNSPFWNEIHQIISMNKLNEGSEKFILDSSIKEIKEKFVEQLKVSAVVGNYVDLFEGWRGKCPFHADEGESLIVKNDNNTFYCPVCRAYGDKYQFIEQLLGIAGKSEIINYIYEDFNIK